MPKAEIEPAAAFAVYANFPFLLVTSQHGAPWNVGTAPLITCAPEASTAYDDAEPAASDTNSRPVLSNAKPNGVAPADALDTPGCAIPSTTANVSIDCVPFSVTTSSSPDGENATCAGFAPTSGCVARGVPDVVSPLIVAEPMLRTYKTSPWTVTLIGRTPPDGNCVSRRRPFGSTANAETVLLPAFTA